MRIGFSECGAVLLGNDVPVVAKPLQTTRLAMGATGSFMIIEGQVEPHQDPVDAWRWRQLHPEHAMRWILVPDVIVWNCADEGPHAFLASEWVLDGVEGFEDEPEVVDHLNRVHPAVLEALLWELTDLDGPGARLVSIDREGLLLANRSRLVHVAFDQICPSARSVDDALIRLLRNLSWLEPAGFAGALPTA